MATPQVIGALRVNLGLDSAQFSAGLKKTQVGLDRFGKVAAIGFAAAATAAVAAGAALAVAGKRAIDTADNMSKTAQKVGVATEALSRLNHAAGYSDVTLEQLTGGLQKLTKNLADVASGQGAQAAVALQALGISAIEADGKLRQADEVFTDIADRFGRMEDGSTKTALALQLFGRAGAEMIPLLNSGKDGLKAMADESDRLGLTISGKTGRAAEQFNDTLNKVGKTLDGVALRVTEAALPALQDMANLLASPEVASAAQTLGATMVTAFTAVVQAVATTTNAIKGFFDWLNGMGGPTPGNGAPLLNGLLPGEKLNLGDRIRGQSNQPTTAGELYSGFGMNADGSLKVAASAPTLNVPTFGGGGGADMAGRLEALRQSLMTEEQLEIDSHAKRLEEIQKFYDEGLIKKGEHDGLVEKAQQDHSDKMIELARVQADEEARIRYGLADATANIFGSLVTIAENAGEKGLAAAKGFAVAQAVVSTAAGIMKAFEQTGVLGFASAAAIAATGAAQISTIMSTTKGSASRPSVGGAAGEVPAASTAAARSISINLQGDTFSAATTKGFLERLNDELGIDGLQIVVAHKQA